MTGSQTTTGKLLVVIILILTAVIQLHYLLIHLISVCHAGSNVVEMLPPEKLK